MNRTSASDVAPLLSPGFKNAVRQQTSLLAPAERVCLSWLAQHMPSRVKSDHLTALGFAAMLVAGICYALARWWPPALLIVNLCLAINWFGDSLDGTLARVRDCQRPRYGFYLDHVLDTLGALSLLVGLLTSLIPMGLNAIGLVALSTVSVPPQLVIALSGAMGPLIQVALQAVPEGAITLFYYDLRIRKEGFDLSYQAEQLAPAA